MEQYGYWIITGAVGLMIGALGWFMKRTLGDIERRIEQTNTQINGKYEVLAGRVEKVEDRLDRALRELPQTYAFRDDLIRMTQNIDGRLDRIQQTLVDMKKGE